MSTYKLVVKGEILPGQDLQEVKAHIAKLFKLQEKPDYLEALFSSRPVTVKKGLDAEHARVYYSAIRQAGMSCEVVAEHETASPLPPDEFRAGQVEDESSALPAKAASVPAHRSTAAATTPHRSASPRSVPSSVSRTSCCSTTSTSVWFASTRPTPWCPTWTPIRSPRSTRPWPPTPASRARRA